MTVSIPAFESLRLSAASQFAQTMIVIDDEASQESRLSKPHPTGTLRPPDRRSRPAKSSTAVKTQIGESSGSGEHSLDAKSLIDKAMDLGLICSVLRPMQGEDFQDRVVKAARIADIVCLDWEIYGDDGDAASKVIGNIIRADAKRNGRLRLIAIYTGDTTNDAILEKVFAEIPEAIREEQRFNKHQFQIESDSGVRIVCLFKAHGIQLPESGRSNQVSESELPERLLIEFSSLSDGLLSNVALATAGAIRSSTHHVLSKFVGTMDGPYFHHRARIENPEDAEGYAVDVVLSEIGGSIDKEQVARDYAGPEAIEARIQKFSEDQNELTLHYLKKENNCTYVLPNETSFRMVRDGIGPVHKKTKLPNLPSKGDFNTKFSTLFSGGLEEARVEMHRFAALTGVLAHPEHHLYRLGTRLAKLGLGTIVQAKDKTFLMCLQASCDSVRVKGEASFLFVPLDREDGTDGTPEHVVPISNEGGTLGFIGLSTSAKTYRVVRSIDFRGSEQTKTVNAEPIKDRPGFYFKDINGEPYRWIADLKRRRALRTAQVLGQNMGRLGFDEFEPYRR